MARLSAARGQASQWGETARRYGRQGCPWGCPACYFLLPHTTGCRRAGRQAGTVPWRRGCPPSSPLLHPWPTVGDEAALPRHHDRHAGPRHPVAHDVLEGREVLPVHPVDAGDWAAVHGSLRRGIGREVGWGGVGAGRPCLSAQRVQGTGQQQSTAVCVGGQREREAQASGRALPNATAQPRWRVSSPLPPLPEHVVGRP